MCLNKTDTWVNIPPMWNQSKKIIFATSLANRSFICKQHGKGERRLNSSWYILTITRKLFFFKLFQLNMSMIIVLLYSYTPFLTSVRSQRGIAPWSCTRSCYINPTDILHVKWDNHYLRRYVICYLKRSRHRRKYSWEYSSVTLVKYNKLIWVVPITLKNTELS